MNVLSMLFGAALVALGVIAAGVADRIRGIRVQRASSPRIAKRDFTPPARATAMGRDVADALTGAGYTTAEAEIATNAVPASQRSTLESWTRGALAQLRAS